MSNHLLASIWRHFPGCGGHLTVMMAIADLATDQGSCFAPMSEIAHRARIARPTTCNIVKSLRQQKWIVTQRRLGRASILTYQINVNKLLAQKPVILPGRGALERLSAKQLEKTSAGHAPQPLPMDAASKCQATATNS